MLFLLYDCHFSPVPSIESGLSSFEVLVPLSPNPLADLLDPWSTGRAELVNTCRVLCLVVAGDVGERSEIDARR